MCIHPMHVLFPWLQRGEWVLAAQGCCQTGVDLDGFCAENEILLKWGLCLAVPVMHAVERTFQRFQLQKAVNV